MQYKADTPAEYVAQLPEDRQVVIKKIRKVLRKHLPKGFKECINYGMIGYVIPHSTYPDGYHCDPKLPLPFAALASQKNFVAVYHSGIYANPKLMKWFVSEWPKHSSRKLDMGKSCIRFKKMDDIPYDLIAELAEKMTPQEFIDMYESQIKR